MWVVDICKHCLHVDGVAKFLEVLIVKLFTIIGYLLRRDSESTDNVLPEELLRCLRRYC
jgi:hypothetical protein